jgi:hypothetical protein
MYTVTVYPLGIIAPPVRCSATGAPGAGSDRSAEPRLQRLQEGAPAERVAGPLAVSDSPEGGVLEAAVEQRPPVSYAFKQRAGVGERISGSKQ